MEQNSQRLLSTEEACQYMDEHHGVQYVPKTLTNMASGGGGPKFQKIGRHRKYTKLWLDEFIASRLSPPVTSTAELKSLTKAA